MASFRRILLVDDHADSLMALQVFLEMHGYEIRQASTHAQAVLLAEQWQPQVVFFDLNLRGALDGLALGQQLRQLVPQARLVILSGSVREEVLHQLESDQFDGFLSKPVDLNELLTYCQG
jgi:CheY-like chemotaxis protein